VPAHLLGIDVGTTFCKAVVVDAAGRVIAEHREPTPWTAVPTGAEVDPDALATAAIRAATGALAAAPGGRVAGVGVAGMAETGVLLGAGGRPIAPAIAWHDRRGAEEAQDAATDLGAEAFARHTGLAPSPLCTLAKLAWQRRHEPAARRAHRWLGVPEWVARRLGGDEVAELSLASRTGLLDLHARAWWPGALAWLDGPASLFADPTPSGTCVGRVGDALPAAHGAAIAVAGHDHLVAMVGAGATGDDDVLHSAGTAEAFVRTSAAHLPPERVQEAVAGGVSVGWHVIPDRWALLSGGELSVPLSGVARMLGLDSREARDRVDAAANALPETEPRPRFEGLDGTGELTLHGIEAGTTPAHVWRAAVDAAAALGEAALGRSDAVAGAHTRIVAVGGGVRGDAVRAAKERRLGIIEWSPVREATARGAALVGGLAAGAIETWDDLAREVVA
jgi:sugar (pentulose or hexulose) kinase